MTIAGKRAAPVARPPRNQVSIAAHAAGRTRSGLKYLGAGVAGVAAAVALQAAPALANSSAAVWDISPAWSANGIRYTESHSGDDIGVNIVTNVALDVRWVTCSNSQHGSTFHLYGDGQGAVRIGNGFSAGTCLKVQMRSSNGSTYATDVSYAVYWNYNIS